MIKQRPRESERFSLSHLAESSRPTTKQQSFGPKLSPLLWFHVAPQVQMLRIENQNAAVFLLLTQAFESCRR